MADKRVFEENIIHINRCIQTWLQKGKPTDFLSLRSLILTWLNRAYISYYNNAQNWRERKAIARGLANCVFFTIDNDHIASIVVQDPIYGKPLNFPVLDYEDLYQRSLIQDTLELRSIDQVSFKNIEQIKFTN